MSFLGNYITLLVAYTPLLIPWLSFILAIYIIYKIYKVRLISRRSLDSPITTADPFDTNERRKSRIGRLLVDQEEEGRFSLSSSEEESLEDLEGRVELEIGNDRLHVDDILLGGQPDKSKCIEGQETVLAVTENLKTQVHHKIVPSVR